MKPDTARPAARTPASSSTASTTKPARNATAASASARSASCGRAAGEQGAAVQAGAEEKTEKEAEDAARLEAEVAQFRREQEEDYLRGLARALFRRAERYLVDADQGADPSSEDVDPAKWSSSCQMPEDSWMDLDDMLVGHWSSLPFSYGVMEASELGLLSDGRGWSAWFNFGALCVTRLRWQCPEPGLLELHAEWTVEGEPGQQVGLLSFSSAQTPEAVSEVTLHHYIVGPAVPLPGAEPLAAITFKEPVEFCNTYARGPREIRAEQDPTHRMLPYPEA
jgi:hypothetical protein